MFHLDYLSCFLTLVSTVLVARKRWSGLVLSGVNSAIIVVIGFRTAQFGLVPANLFCIAVYALSLRSWRRPAIERSQEQADRDALRFAMGRERADAFLAARPLPPAPKPRYSGLQIVSRTRLQNAGESVEANEPNQSAPRLGLVSSGRR